MAKPIELTGEKIGKLTIISLIPESERKNSYKRREWFCKCDCGNEIVIEQRNLTGNKYQQVSCGCIRVKAAFVATTKNHWITLDYVERFSDFEKYAFLHKQLVKHLKVVDDEQFYYQFIDKFYNQKQFNSVYNFWKQNEKEDVFYDWHKPSLDHIIPKSKGGQNDLDNLQFLTVFENLSKRDMTMSEWEDFKKKSKTTSDLFIENIIDKY